MTSMSSGGGSSTPLNTSGVDFANQTQAYNFLQELLNDSAFQPTGTAAARKFWYGVVVVVGVAALQNIIWKATLRARLVRQTLLHAELTVIVSALISGSADNRS